MRKRSLMLIALAAAFAAGDALADYASMCKEAVKRKREIIWQVWDRSPYTWAKGEAFNVAKFPAKSGLTELAKAPVMVDTVVFIPLGNFANLSANIPSSEPVKRQPQGSWQLAGVKNVIEEFFKAGTDTVKEASKWARAEKKEFFVSLPVNAKVHAGAYNLKAPPPPWIWNNYLIGPWKLKNMMLLMGGPQSEGAKASKGKAENPPHGSWLSVDYGLEPVREKYCAMVKDIADKYDIDGIVVDMSSGELLAEVAWGATASAKTTQALTDMMTKIKGRLQAASEKKNHAILLVVRVPDSAGYCKDIGIDLGGWLEAKIPDLVITAGQYNQRSVMGEFFKKYGTPYYASIGPTGIYVGNDSGWSGDDERMPRHSKPSIAARMMEALGPGNAAGMYCGNDPYNWHRVGPGAIVPANLKDLKYLNKRYFTTPTAAGGFHLKDGAKKYLSVPQLYSGSPKEMKSGVYAQSVCVWDDVAARQKEGKAPQCFLTTEVAIPGGMDIEVTLNGKKLKLVRKYAGCQEFEAPLNSVKYGKNDVTVKPLGKNKRGNVCYIGNIAIDVVFDMKAAGRIEEEDK